MCQIDHTPLELVGLPDLSRHYVAILAQVTEGSSDFDRQMVILSPQFRNRTMFN